MTGGIVTGIARWYLYMINPLKAINMDEELLDMMALNKAFGAMARYATTVDEMLDRNKK